MSTPRTSGMQAPHLPPSRTLGLPKSYRESQVDCHITATSHTAGGRSKATRSMSPNVRSMRAPVAHCKCTIRLCTYVPIFPMPAMTLQRGASGRGAHESAPWLHPSPSTCGQIAPRHRRHCTTTWQRSYSCPHDPQKHASHRSARYCSTTPLYDTALRPLDVTACAIPGAERVPKWASLGTPL